MANFLVVDESSFVSLVSLTLWGCDLWSKFWQHCCNEVCLERDGVKSAWKRAVISKYIFEIQAHTNAYKLQATASIAMIVITEVMWNSRIVRERYLLPWTETKDCCCTMIRGFVSLPDKMPQLEINKHRIVQCFKCECRIIFWSTWHCLKSPCP